MVAEAVVWVDVESAVREWGRDNIASVDRRVLFARNEKGPLPQVIVQRVAGPDSECLIQLDVIASSKAAAAALATEVATEVDALARYVTDDVILHAAAVESSRWLPDPVSKEARYVIDATFVASATSSTGS